MSKVEEFFITPLEAHYDVQPKEGPRQVIVDDLDNYRADDLHAAGEWLKRNKQSVTSFPSPKECNAAIEAVTNGSGGKALATSELVKRETYGDIALAYCKATNKGKPVIISRLEKCWDEWEDYYKALEMNSVLEVMSQREKWTVPSHFPSQFDPTFKAQ